MSIIATTNPIDSLQEQYGSDVAPQLTCDGIPTFWTPRERVREILGYLKGRIDRPYAMLYDLTAIDERMRVNREERRPRLSQFVYHLFSFERNEYIRMKTALPAASLSLDSITSLWPAANWYEREVWDMFGISFSGHPHLQRILMPKSWTGHPLRKDHPARATEMGPFHLSEEKEEAEQELLRFRPEEWGMQRSRDGSDFIFLNLGPQHPGTHGVLRIVVQLDGEEIVDAVPEIGFHHRGAEKMGERQSWHTYIPYTDRVDYLGGVMNNLAYLMAVEKLAGITVPLRAQVIRVMLCELFRIISHLVWYGTFAQDLGQLSPVFYTFNDRERAFGIIEAICGARMHPNWFRIGGVAADLPEGWDGMFRDFIRYFPPRLAEYDREVMRNRIFQARTKGIGSLHKTRSDRVGRHRTRTAGLRLRMGLSQEAALFGLRAVRVRYSYRHPWRLLRPGSGPCGGDAAEPPHHRTVRESHAGWTIQVRSSAGDSSGKGSHHARYRNPHHTLPECRLGAGDTAR